MSNLCQTTFRTSKLLKQKRTQPNYFTTNTNVHTLLATVHEYNKVAAHVHCDTIVVAVRPTLT